MTAVDRNAGSFVTIGGKRGVFLRPLALALAASVLMCAAPAAAQIPFPVPNLRFDIHPGSGGAYHHRYTSRGVSHGTQKPGDAAPNPSTTPSPQTVGGQSPSGGAASQVPPPSAQVPSSPPPPAGTPPGTTPAHSEARGGADFEPAK